MSNIRQTAIILNHIENIKGLCTKTGLLQSLRRYYKSSIEMMLANYNIHKSIPSTFIALPNCQDAEYQSFIKCFNEIEQGKYKKCKIPSKHCTDNVWLIKPAALNQGKGIEIFKNDLAGMKKFLESKPTNSYWIIQKYIERPLLYYGRKLDIRVWTLLTSKKEVYYYTHGYIRTSSNEYSLNTKRLNVHLTNNCLQQLEDDYGLFEEGNTIEFGAFKEYLRQKYGKYQLDFERDIIERIKDLIIDSYFAVKSEINPNKRKNSFELLGYDFLIDEDFRVWLIEVNSNPYLGLPNKFIEGLLPKMLNDLFELVIDPYIKVSNTLPERSIWFCVQ